MTHLKAKKEPDPQIKILENQFIDFIKNRLGIVMHAHQQYELFKTVHEACIRFDCTPEAYLKKLIDCPNQSPLLDHLISGITVGETYFFRDQQQMQLLQHYILPDLIKKKREQNTLSLRIWSAGCATGEEIYSIVMILYELLPDIHKWTIKLLATDINTKALQKSIVGSYSEWSMRSTPEYFKKKYFEQEGRQFILSKKVRNLVSFEYLNLNEDSYPSIFNGTNAQDLVLCRNVLIYINSESCNFLMIKMNKCLVSGGYLMLGASDPIHLEGTDFIFHYRKGLLFSRPTIEKLDLIQPVEIIKTKSVKTNKMHTYKPNKKIETPQHKIEPVKKEKNDITTKAIELANLGKLEEAIKLCEEGFKLSPTNKLNYFTYGLALSELNKLEEAEKAFRKTVFLDNQFVAGHFQLGLLLLRKNQQDSGLKSLKNALVIAESRKPDEFVPGSPGLCYRQLADILQNEINIHITTGT